MKNLRVHLEAFTLARFAVIPVSFYVEQSTHQRLPASTSRTSSIDSTNDLAATSRHLRISLQIQHVMWWGRVRSTVPHDDRESTVTRP
jgi:hypothetical protein